MRRGEVWWADLGPSAGRHPVVLLTRDAAYGVRTLLTIAPVTSRVRGIASEVPLGSEDGLPRPCVANLDSITTIEASSLLRQVATLSADKMKAVDRAIHYALGLQN